MTALRVKPCTAPLFHRLRALLVVPLVLLAIGRPAHAACPAFLLPPLSAQATNPPRFMATDGAPASFYHVNLENVAPGYSVTNGGYLAWCIDYFVPLPVETLLTAHLLDSTAPLPPFLQNTNWDMVNYILNHKQGTAFDVQGAIWHFIGGPIPTRDPAFFPPSIPTLLMIEDALAHGDGFLPTGPGAVVAVILDSGPQIQTLVIEAHAPSSRPPVANPDALRTRKDTLLSTNASILLVNDLSPNGAPLQILGVSPNSTRGGTVLIAGATLAYTPPPGFVGLDTFTYSITDGVCDTATTTVTVSVIPPLNQVPNAIADNVATLRDQPIVIPATLLLANDTDPDGDLLVIITVSSNSVNGGIVLLVGTNIVYTPPPGFVGIDTFTYTVSDGQGGTATATVTVNVARPNGVPTAMNDFVSVLRDQPLQIPAAQLLANDTDPDGDLLAIISVSTRSTQGGTVILVGTNVLYTPPPGFVGIDTFTYTISDGHGATATATVVVTVKLPNHPPMTGNLAFTTLRNTPLDLPLSSFLALASDPDGDVIEFERVPATTAANGHTILTNGNVRYVPLAGFTGTDSFYYVVNDGRGLSATGTVTITVLASPLGMIEEAAIFNPQTGLFEQRVTISNESSNTIAAHRIFVTHLRTNIRVWNASGVLQGTNFIQFNSPLNPGQSATFRIEYYVPDRLPFTPVLILEPTLPVPQTPAQGGAGVAIHQTFLDTRIPGEPRLVIEFTSIPGRIYTIIYSDDMSSWKAATPAVPATANRTQWYDDGPPKTDRKPVTGSRFYRVIQAP
ncbi:MAG: hypothetical protein QOF48_2751 [Verrucomicrobiota bacterium]|jgi:hypothetical protein